MVFHICVINTVALTIVNNKCSISHILLNTVAHSQHQTQCHMYVTHRVAQPSYAAKHSMSHYITKQSYIPPGTTENNVSHGYH